MSDRTPAVGLGSMWVKKHGNVLTRLKVIDAANDNRLLLRVVGGGGSASYRRGQEVCMSAWALTFYYREGR